MKLAALQTKMQFKTKQDKVEKRQTHDLMDFLGKKTFFGKWFSQYVYLSINI